MSSNLSKTYFWKIINNFLPTLKNERKNKIILTSRYIKGILIV